MKISDRKKKILAAVIDEYIRTAEPVASKTIAGTAGLTCSSATIRNELSELTSLGFLEQPHTSAGRIPTPQGYRLYVNELMEKQKLSLLESEELNSKLNSRLAEMDTAISDIGRLASQLTDLPVLALTSAASVTISRFDLIYVDSNTFIIVVLLSNNKVMNKLVHLPVSVDAGTVTRLSTLFNANFTGITDSEITPTLISATERSTDDTIGLVAVIASFAITTLSNANTASSFVTGENRLLKQPEFRDHDKANRLMSYLSGGGHLLPGGQDIPDRDEVRVLIGPENVAEELKDSSVVLASYDAGDNTRGLIGVVGPTRMDYSTIAAKLAILADGLSRRLGGSSMLPPEGMNNKLIIKSNDDFTLR